MIFTKKKKIISVLILLVVIFLAWFFFFKKKDVAIETYSVKKGDIAETVMETGSVQAAQMGVYSASSGVVEELYVKNGDSVKIGQKLFKVKSTSTDKEIASAYANYVSAMSNLKKAEQDKKSSYTQLLSDKKNLTDAKGDKKYQKNNDTNPKTNNDYTTAEKKSLEQDISAKESAVELSQQKYDDSDTAIAAANANVEASKLSYEATRDSTSVAQVSGVVSNLSAKVGDVVYYSDISVTSSTVASPVLIVGNLSGYTIKISVNEMERTKMRLDQKASIKFDAVSGKAYSGTVKKIDDFGVSESGVVTYNAYLSIDDQDSSILPNMTANVTVETASKNNIVVVPNKALKPYKNGKGVQLAHVDNTGKQIFEYVPVTTGLKSSSQTEITGGIDEGAIIALSDNAVVTGPTQK
ncbi:MAG: Efflux transporter, RND family, MFP subunit [Candidatus Moranbacteria bacterium GW2011_GWE1_36_7]|nr:MAG: Efflux transporter, RND family, MFP subunit [Candidatus Moranbacteria bacterium GW2011_GWD2_36_12]KKQ05219.1 MAG: Efflux transporter, RND family, MFP subunit [Candidatus Moranbacteria bacterium GW2011_GWE2_36_40]KKQ14357.1 MAG: Efflux transporter, RND family, MFP subunit [Candidatus Moranbacteria bacterium GW2011_GWE1_36_7]